MDHKFDQKTLYVVSPRPGAKLRLVRDQLNIPHDCILTTQKVAPMAYGNNVMASTGEGSFKPREMSGKMASLALRSAGVMRASQEMATVIVDSECVSDMERKEYYEAAKEANLDIKFITMDASVADAKNFAKHTNQMLSYVMDNYSRFNPESQYETIKFDQDLTFSYDYHELPDDKYDVIGDIHGMAGEMRDLIKDLGYEIHNETASHPKGRKILFMGDYVDRGYDSLSVLRLVKNTVESGNGLAILGNHEDMLIDAFDSAKKYGMFKPSSLSSGETVDALLRTNENERESIMDFLKGLPCYYTYKDNNGEKYAFVHADVESFDPLQTPKMHLMHGDGNHVRKDSDLGYQRLFTKGYNEYTLIRGHAINTSKQKNVISLEAGQAFGGEMLAMPFDKMLSIHKLKGYSPYRAAESAMVSVKCSNKHNYRFRKEAENQLYGVMEDIVAQGYAEKHQNIDKGLNLYIATKKSFESDLFFSSTGLQKATGLVLDLGGRVVIHPPDRVGDAGDEIPYPNPNDKVVAIEDTRGFNINVSKDPYGTGLLMTTSASLESRYTHMAEDMLKQKGIYDKLNNFLSNKDITLSFAVRHPEDKRSLISDKNKSLTYGATLITSRKNTPNGATMDEASLDKVAKIIGADRPRWTITPFKSVISNMVVGYYSGTNRGEEKEARSSVALRMIDDKGKQQPLRFKLPSPRRIEEDIAKTFTAGGVDRMYEDNGASLKNKHYVFRLAAHKLLTSYKKEDLKKKFDLAGIRADESLSPEEKKERGEKAKEEKLKEIHMTVKNAYRQVLREKADPVKQKIMQRLDEEKRAKEERDAHFKEAKKREKEKSKSNSFAPK